MGVARDVLALHTGSAAISCQRAQAVISHVKGSVISQSPPPCSLYTTRTELSRCREVDESLKLPGPWRAFYCLKDPTLSFVAFCSCMSMLPAGVVLPYRRHQAILCGEALRAPAIPYVGCPSTVCMQITPDPCTYNHPTTRPALPQGCSLATPDHSSQPSPSVHLLSQSRCTCSCHFPLPTQPAAPTAPPLLLL